MAASRIWAWVCSPSERRSGPLSLEFCFLILDKIARLFYLYYGDSTVVQSVGNGENPENPWRSG